MTQVSRIPLRREIEKRMFDIFIDAISDVRGKRSTHQFITDLLSSTEKTMLSKRLAIALLLFKGYTQKEIIDTLKVSSGTVSRVSVDLQTRGHGCRRVISTIISREQREQFWEKIDDLLSEIIPPSRRNWSAARRERWQHKLARTKAF